MPVYEFPFFAIMVIILIVWFGLALVVYHRLTKRVSELSLKIAHLESSTDMLLESNRELHQLVLVYMQNQ